MNEPLGGRSQVTLRTVFTVCFGVLAVVFGAYAIDRTQVAITITLIAGMIAIALNHAVTLLMRTGLRRGLAIWVVGVLLVGLGALLALLLVPAAVSQAQVLAKEAPQLLEKIRQTRLFSLLDQRFQLSAAIDRAGTEVPGLIFRAVNVVLGLIGAGVTVLFLAVFMLIFGAPLLDRMLTQVEELNRGRLRAILDKIYGSVGGYIAGITLICWINTIATMTFLAILRMPFFLPLAILSGMSSLVPYVGSIVTGGAITLVALATTGEWQAVACAIWFITYGQIEGNIFGPLIFRRTVHVNPLITTLSILFFGEAAGIVGAIVAIPVVAALQIVVREILNARRAQQGQPRLPSHPTPAG
jgi:predicted PurR-regulated permease PerM